MKEKIREAIGRCLKKNKKIAIYPFGVYGKMVKEILNQEFGLQECCIVDNYCADREVQCITEIDTDQVNDYCWLIACVNDAVFTEIVKSLDELGVDRRNIEDVFGDEHYYHLYAPAFMLYDAARQGITLAQYYENHYNALGVKSDTVMDKVADAINLPGGGNICEIGPGSGRLLVKLMEKFKPKKYEFYEIEKKLAEYVEGTYQYPGCQLIRKEADGESLKETEDESQDLVFASNIFSLISYANTYQYFLEMMRVCKRGGYIVFDAHTEDALAESALNNGQNPVNTWRITPQIIIENIFAQRKMKLIGKFKNLMVAGIGADNRKVGNIVETWYIYKKGDIG
ncbi:MAG: class I SAM-dependent methyltransferase [Lachnospiraceae bacterium]|nr:class I SAM-dependent methyltransferase [Lachnospiraceae bacterium]